MNMKKLRLVFLLGAVFALAGSSAVSAAVPQLERPANGAKLAAPFRDVVDRDQVKLAKPVTTDRLFLHLASPPVPIPAALFKIRCYEC